MKKEEPPPKEILQKPPVVSPQPVIEEVIEDPSLEQTPIKEDSVS